MCEMLNVKSNVLDFSNSQFKKVDRIKKSKRGTAWLEKEKESDTTVILTQKYESPEQYGAQHTDGRSVFIHRFHAGYCAEK